MRAGGRHTRRRYKQKLVSHCRHAGFLQQMEIIYPRQSQSRSSSGQGREAGKRASSQRFETISSDPACIYYLSIFMCKQTASSIQC